MDDKIRFYRLWKYAQIRIPQRVFYSLMWVIGLLAIVAFMILFMAKTQTSFMYEYLTDLHKDYFSFFLVVTGTLVASMSFSEIKNSKTRYIGLMLPVSNKEKWLFEWLYCALFWPIICLIIYVLFTLVLNTFITMYWPIDLSVDSGSKSNNYFEYNWSYVLMTLLFLQSLFFVGALWFKSFAWVKTILILLVVVLGGSYIYSFLWEAITNDSSVLFGSDLIELFDLEGGAKNDLLTYYQYISFFVIGILIPVGLYYRSFKMFKKIEL